MGHNLQHFPNQTQEKLRKISECDSQRALRKSSIHVPDYPNIRGNFRQHIS